MKQFRKQRKPTEFERRNATVKIYRRHKTVAGTLYTVFETADYSTGQRVLRSSSDEARARNEAEKIAKCLAAGDIRGAQLRGTNNASCMRPVGDNLSDWAGESSDKHGGRRVPGNSLRREVRWA